MATSAILSIKILTDATGAAKGVDQASSKIGKLQSAVGKMAVPAAIAGAAIVAFGKQAYDAASKTQQAFGAVDTVFGKSAGKVKDWADAAATAVGLSKSDYAELASTLGASLKNMGVPMDKLAGQTNDLVTLGADLAATYGGTTKDAVDALGSALRGETDPIEKYGISIKQATIAAEMAKEGTDKLTGSAATAAHTHALLALVTQQSGKAVGQFARESDSAAGSTQIASARYENMKSTLGTALLPVVASLMGMMAKLTGIMQDHAGIVQVVAGVLLALVVAIIAINAALKLQNLVLALSEAQWVATWAAAILPVALVVLAIAAVVAIFVVLYHKSATFKRFVDTVWAAVKTGARTAAGVIGPLFRVLFAVITGYVKAWWAYLKLVFGIIKGAVQLLVAVFKGDWRGAFEAVRGIINSFRDFFRTLFGLLPNPVQKVITKITDGLGGALDDIVSALSGLGATLAAPWVTMYNAVDDVIGKVSDLIDWISRIHVPDLGGLLSHLPGVNMVTPPAGGAPVPSLAALTGRTGTGRTGTAGGAAPTIVIQGALDPEAVARQIRRILRAHDRRTGNVSAA